MLVRQVVSVPLVKKPIGRDGTVKLRNQLRLVDSQGPSEGMLIVGHGSYCKISANQMHQIGSHVARAFPDVLVEVGFLEMTEPPANRVLDAMVASGCRRIVVMPFMLLAATHSKSDVPAIIVEGRQRHPQVEFVFASSLGVVPELIEIAASNVEEVGGAKLPLLVIARGTSDPDANGDAIKVSRILGEWLDSGLVSTGFTGMTWPLTPQALDQMAALARLRTQQGPGPSEPVPKIQIALFFWFICNGKLIERAREQIADFENRTGVEVLDAGYFGPDERLVQIVAQRYQEALMGNPVLNCDTCAYRAPFPGQEEKVGKPIGEGHSHFAADHRAGVVTDHSHDHSHGHSHSH